MDTSKEYIKMCDCPEIQEHSEKYNDRCCFWANRLIDGSFSIWADLHKEDSIWLPRQDQIQGMMEKSYDHISTMITYFNLFSNNEEMLKGLYGKHRFEIKLKSMEQLWLAFYMYEKHGKVWDGEEWLKKL